AVIDLVCYKTKIRLDCVFTITSNDSEGFACSNSDNKTPQSPNSVSFFSVSNVGRNNFAPRIESVHRQALFHPKGLSKYISVSFSSVMVYVISKREFSYWRPHVIRYGFTCFANTQLWQFVFVSESNIYVVLIFKLFDFLERYIKGASDRLLHLISERDSLKMMFFNEI